MYRLFTLIPNNLKNEHTCKLMNFDHAFKYCQEIINVDHLKEKASKKQLHGYWGTAPTGKPHIAYLVPILSLSRMIKEGCKITIMIADYHAALDNHKTEWEALHSRTEYYTEIIKELFKLTGVDPTPTQLQFTKGTDHQRGNPAYLDDLLKLSTEITVNIAKKATAEVVKCSSNPPLSNCIYPLMQVLDEVYLETDFEFGGVDQRKIFMFGIDYLPRIGYKEPRCYIMNPMIHSLGKEGKMSASETNSKIDLLDLPDDIMKKCRKAFTVDGVVENNGVMELLKYVIFEMPGYEQGLTVCRPEQYGGDILFRSYIELERAYIAKEVSSVDLKESLGNELVKILAPLRRSKCTDLAHLAY
jgi:tyrosyl-tRNA synthetase